MFEKDINDDIFDSNPYFDTTRNCSKYNLILFHWNIYLNNNSFNI